MRTLLLTHSVLVLTHSTSVRINVIIISVKRPHLVRLWVGSLMSACKSHTTFCCLDNNIVFLRTRLPWARTARSTFGCANLFLWLLCIHSSILHIYSFQGKDKRTFLSFTKKEPSYESCSSSIKSIILRNIVKGHPKTTLGTRHVEDHVYPDLTRRVQTICMLISTLFQFCNLHVVVAGRNDYRVKHEN